MNTAKTAAVLALCTSIIFSLLLAVVHLHGISQQYFEMVHTPEKYTEEIVEHSAALNKIFVLDNIFIILYTSTALFTIKELSNPATSFITLASYSLIGIVAILDFVENFHIYTLMLQAVDGITVSAEDIRWQSAESMLKWHLAYFAFFLLGFLVPSNTTAEKILKYALWFWFVPSGVLLYAVTNTPYAALFQWMRFLNLVAGFILIWIIMRKRED